MFLGADEVADVTWYFILLHEIINSSTAPKDIF